MVNRRSKKYNGELDNINPYQHGIDLFKKGNEINFNLTEAFSGGCDDDPIWDFLSDFDSKVKKGFYYQKGLYEKELYLSQLSDFQKNIPNVGDIVYFSFPTNKNVYFKASVEYVDCNKGCVLVKFIDTENNDSYNEGLKYRILGYEYSPEKSAMVFIKFYKEKPKLD